VDPAPVSAILPTWRRLDVLPGTLERLHECEPPPAEIIVHVDGGDENTASWIEEHWPEIRVLKSERRQGPGGGRNKLLDAATQPYVASFDDDSYPLDPGYFNRVVKAFERHPTAGVLATSIYHRGEDASPPSEKTQEVADFVGCGCAYRQAAWKHTAGYLPRAWAYGLEETDMALQLLDEGWTVLHDHRLRVRHDTDLSHHEDPEKTASGIANRALQAYVRYPVQYVGWGIAQYFNRIWWCLNAGRTEGIVQGIIRTPAVLWKYRAERDAVSPATLRKYRQLRQEVS